MLTLVKLTEEHMPLLVEMMDEWTAEGEKIVPWAIARMDYHEYEPYRESLEAKPGQAGMVPDSTYFCLDTEQNRFVGAVNIRHWLNDGLLFDGGHIGDGIRPSQRGKGLGTQMVGLALEKCRELGMKDVLMVCNRNNRASAGTIRKNGGVLANEVQTEEGVMQRYWITL